MADLGTSDDGWHLVVGHPAMEIREEQQIEQWERSKGHWSGCGKHPANWNDHKTLRVLDRELGVGSYGVVERITYGAVTMARKHVKPRRGMTVEKLREEANAMERLVHKHILKLVGTYTWKRNDLYLLLYPAAVCDLSRFLDDIDDIRNETYADREDAFKRLRMLKLQDVGKAEDLIAPREHGSAAGSAPKVPTAVGFLQQILGCVTEALEYVHEKDIRHRDLKPKNILLSPGRVYLADFGIARIIKESEDSITSGRCGTPFWIAPEVHDEQDHHMSKADVWSLGCIFLNIATLLYGETLAMYDETMKEQDWKKKYESLEKHLGRLRHKAKVAALHHPDAPNLDAKHILGLIDDMLKQDPEHRPSAKEVNAKLSELGGLEQIYHLPCCHKKSSYLTKSMNTKLKIAHDANAASVRRILQVETENAKLKERLHHLEELHDTYQQRIDNQDRRAGAHYDALQKKYDREVETRKALEERVKALENQLRGPPRRPGSQNRGRGRSFGATHYNGSPNIPPGSNTPQNNPSNGLSNTQNLPPPTPSPSPKGPIRTLTSYLPQPVRPTTPMRPSLSRGDPGSTSSTMISSTASIFSRASAKTEDSLTSTEDATLRSEEPESPLTIARGRRVNGLDGDERKSEVPWRQTLVIGNGREKDGGEKVAEKRPVAVQKPSYANMAARSARKV